MGFDTLASIGAAGFSAYLVGNVVGAPVAGWLTDRLGRRKLLFYTLWFYILSTVATALSFGPSTLATCRFLTGVGVAGELVAINAAIPELFS